jgi:hypothetical protein
VALPQLDSVFGQADDPFNHHLTLERVANHHQVAAFVLAEMREQAIDDTTIPRRERRDHAPALDHHDRDDESLNQ